MTRKLKINALELKLRSLREEAEKEDNFLIRYRLIKQYEKYQSFLEGYHDVKRQHHRNI